MFQTTNQIYTHITSYNYNSHITGHSNDINGIYLLGRILSFCINGLIFLGKSPESMDFPVVYGKAPVIFPLNKSIDLKISDYMCVYSGIYN